MTPEQLATVDIAVMNLRAAEGLPGAENLNIQKELETLDQITKRVESETVRNFYRFNRDPAYFKNSEPYYRMMLMAMVLQEDFNVRYHPDKKSLPGAIPPEDDPFFKDSRDVFLYGLLQRQMGTCSSMPVLYIAIGRRLGYPLKLVNTKSHLYLRWEDGRTRMNVEATSEGFNDHPDDHYRSFPFPVTDEEVEKFEYFKAMTPKEELACFLSLRGECLMATEQYEKGLIAHEDALRADPDSYGNKMALNVVRKFVEQWRAYEQRPPDAGALALLPFTLGGGDEFDQVAARAIRMSQQRRGEPVSLMPISAMPQNSEPGIPPNSVYSLPEPAYKTRPGTR